MASENNTTDNTKVKYKFGTSELPLDLYIKNLKDNYQSYIDSRNWSDGQKAEFKGAFDNYIQGFQDQLDNGTSRFSTDYTGTVFDNDGLITEKDSDDYYYDSKGNQYTSEQYNGFKPKQQKNYYAFNANRQAASYLNIIGKALRDKLNSTTSSTSASSTKFDYNTNGFARWYKNKYQPLNEQLDFNTDKELDKNEDGSYGTAKRAASLSTAIGEYINSLSNDLDYSELGGKDKYIANLNAAINSLKDGYSTEDITALRQLIGDDFIKAYFDTSTGTTEQGSSVQQALKETQAQIVAMNEEDALKQAQQKLAAMQTQRARKQAFSNYRTRNPFSEQSYSFNDQFSKVSREADDETATKYYLEQIFGNDAYSISNKDIDKVLNYLNEHDIAIQDLLWNNERGMRFFSSLINGIGGFKDKLKIYEEGNTTYYIIPNTFNKKDYSVRVWNPNRYVIKEIPVEKLNESLQDEYLYNNGSLWDSNNFLIPYQKQGGILKAQDGQYFNKLRAESQKKKRLEESDTRTPEEKTAGARTLSDGLTGTDLARLGAIGADIVSAISSFVPGYGTAVSAVSGIGSTVTTAIADMVEDGFQWSDLGNGLIGLGMDVAGLLPGIGTGAKFSKIGKQLIKYAPMVLGFLQAQNALSEPAMASWNKISNGEYSKLTVDDLRNIASGITLLTSGANQAGIRLKNSAMKEAAKTGNYQIETKTGEMAKITPEKLDELKKAKTLEEQNKILQSIPGNEGIELKSRVRGNWNPSRIYNNNPSIADEYDWSKLRDVEKSWSDASIFKGVRTTTFNPNVHINIKNPYTGVVTATTNTPKPKNYDRLRELSGRTTPLTQQEINLINKQRANSGKSKLTQAEINELNQRRQARNSDVQAQEQYNNSWEARVEQYKADKQNKITAEEELKRAQDELAEAKTASERAKIEAEALGLQIGSRRDARLQARERLDRYKQQKEVDKYISEVSQYSAPLTPQYKRPLTGAAYNAKQRNYEELFGLPKPSDVSTKILGTSEVSSYNGLAPSNKGLQRRANKQKKLEEEEAKRARNAEAYISSSRQKQQEGKQQKKKSTKKTSKDDRKMVIREQGGSLNVSKVRKMANGDSIPIVSPNWYNARWKGGTALQGWNNSLNQQNSVNTSINNNHHYKADTLDDVFASNQAYTSNHNAVQSDLQGYYDSDFASNNTDINTFIQKYNKDAANLRSFFDSPLTYNSAGATSHNQLFKKMFASRSAAVDNTNKGYALGYDDAQQDIVGSTTWARRMDQYETDFEKLTDDAARTYDIKIDNETYKVYKKANGDIALLSNDEPSGETSPAAQDPIDTSKRTGVRTEGSGNGNNDKLTKGKGKVLINPTYIYGLPRAIMSDRDNRRMTDLAKLIIKPVLTDPIESYKYTRSDLNEEINGEQAKAAIVNAASQPLTSDASYEAARRLAAEVKGNEYKLQGLQKSDQVRDTYDEQNWQLQQQNAQNRHDVAMANRKGMAAAQYNKGTQELAYMSKKNNIWDTYGQQLEYEAKSEYQKAKAAQEKMLLSAIQKDVYYNPVNHGILLTPEQWEIWKEALRTGTVPSDNAKYQQYLAVYNKLQEKINELAASHYGFTYTPVNQEILNDTSWGPKIITERLGGKLAKGGRTSADYIAVAGIQARTSDANRFQRQIKATIDRNEKVIDRLARSMYDLIKLAK